MLASRIVIYIGPSRLSEDEARGRKRHYTQFDNHGGSTMSDYDRNASAAQYGRTLGQTTVAVDEGLRAYMLRIYNYMVLGLAITGLAALGIYMLSITSDASLAARS